MSIIENCTNCYYSMPLASNKACVCRRHAPSPCVGGLNVENLARFPVVRADWWCGDWKEDS